MWTSDTPAAHMLAEVRLPGWASGQLESIFPRGIPIGRVSKVSSDELKLYRQAHITPFADFKSLDNVEVITPRLKQPTNPGSAGP